MHSDSGVSTPGLDSPIRIAGRYRLLETIGTGGMASVHRALDEASGRIVALKQLVSAADRGRLGPTVEALFEREYRTLVRLKHPRIIEVYDYGVAENGRYFTMELLDGQDLDQIGVQPHEKACRLLRDVASSLALIHAHRLIHRDVSPRNVRLTQDGRPMLIDFGALAPFGIADDLIGTPPCMAPELLYGDPLDQRADLFSLGAVAYWLLTGRHAYPARRMQDLPTIWETPPAPPSHFAADVPPALDGLVLSLLSLDRIGRPPNAGVVIDELTRIAGLVPEEHEHTIQSYMLSSRVVGLQRELDSISKRIRRAQKNQGALISIEGAPGIGKSCLIREACVVARVHGAVVLGADARATAEPFGTAVALGLELLETCPELARRAAAASAGLLARLSPRLAAKLGDVPPSDVPQDPSERRARFQAALHSWFLDVSRERPLFIAVDDAHAADENSATFLAAVGSEATRTKLVVVVSLRTGQQATSEAAVRTILQRSKRVKLGPLSAESCKELVTSLFGDVANGARVAQLLFEKSAGIPGPCMDLAQLLVTKKIAKYSGGTWLLPQDIVAHELPSRAEELLASRLAGLSPAARRLADSLSIHFKPVMLQRCLALAPGHEGETYAALDELVAEQILRSEAGSYRFTHESVRRALVDNLDDARRRANHMRAAEVLLADEPNLVAARIEAALHLLDAGEERRGVEILVKLGFTLTSTVDFNAGSDTVLALARALECLERREHSEYESFALLFPMLKLAYYSPHFKLILEHGERALAIGFRITGLTTAQDLRQQGRADALQAGLAWGAKGFAEQQRCGLGYDLKTAIVATCGMLPAVLGALGTALDRDAIARIERMAEPLTLFPPDQVARVLHNWVSLEHFIVLGQDANAHREAARFLDINKAPAVREAMGEVNWRSQFGGLLFLRSLYDAYTFGDAALRGTAELEQVGLRVWAMVADQVRVLYHAYRGESQEVQRCQERVEMFALQGSATWQTDMFWPVLLLSVAVMSGDAMSARAIAEQLTRSAHDVDSLRLYADAARAADLMLRGDALQSVALYERIIDEFPVRRRIAYERTRTHYAQALNLAGEPARAKAIALEVINAMEEADHELLLFIEAHRQLALAEAALGNHAEAIHIVDALLAQHGQWDNRLFVGLLHKVRAELALQLGDAGTFEAHAREVEHRFRSTRNPALIAQCERLFERGARAGVREIEPMGVVDAEAVHDLMTTSASDLSGLETANDVDSRALTLLLSRAHAETGFLYIRRENTMRLAAASVQDTPPSYIEAKLNELATEACSKATEGDADSERRLTTSSLASELDTSAESTISSQCPTTDDEDIGETQLVVDTATTSEAALAPVIQPDSVTGSYQVALLETRTTMGRVVVGGFAIRTNQGNVAHLRKGLLRGIAQVLLHHRRPAL